MSIVHYTVIPPAMAMPTDMLGKLAQAGYGLSAAGTGLQKPQPDADAALLVFHDAIVITKPMIPDLVQALAAICDEDTCDGIFADFERPVSEDAVAFLQALEEALLPRKQLLLVPQVYIPYTKYAQAVCSWNPAMGALDAAILTCVNGSGRPVWVEYAPVCQWIPLPWRPEEHYDITQEDMANYLREQNVPVFFSDKLCCNYTWTLADGKFTLCLFDTTATLQKKEQLFQTLPVAGTITLLPERQACEKGSLPDGKEP